MPGPQNKFQTYCSHCHTFVHGNHQALFRFRLGKMFRSIFPLVFLNVYEGQETFHGLSVNPNVSYDDAQLIDVCYVRCGIYADRVVLRLLYFSNYFRFEDRCDTCPLPLFPYRRICSARNGSNCESNSNKPK